MVPHWWPAAPDVIWHIYLHLHCSTGDGGRESPSSGDVALTMGQVHCEFWADWPRFSFLGEAKLREGPSSLALPRMVPHQWPVALVVIWHIYSCLVFSLEDSARDLPSSGKVVLGQGQVPYEFWADQPNFIFQPVAPDMIWHIYSGQCCFKGTLGMDLLSSGDVALMMGQVSCEIWADWPTFIFQPVASDMFLHIYLHLYCSSRDGEGTCHLQGGSPYHGAGPLWDLSRLANLHFSAGGSWHDLAHLLQAVLLNGGSCHPLAIFRGGAPWSVEGPL